MRQRRIGRAELLQLKRLLAVVLDDAELIGELSLMEREHVKAATAALQHLFPAIDRREAEDSLNEG